MRLLPFFAALTLLLYSTLAQAATLNFNGGAVSGCSLPASSKQYTCASLIMGSTDNVVIASGYGVTVNSDVSIGYNQGLSMSGTAALTANRNIDISNVNPPNLKITGGSLTASGGSFKVGSQGGTVLVADISAASVSVGGTPVKVTGSITATGNIDISSGSTLSGAINGGSITTSSNVTISGSMKASGSVSIGSSSTITGPIDGSSITTSSSVTITGDVTAVNAFSLGSGSNLKGITKAPIVSIDASNSQVQGDITADTSLTVGSGSQIKGNLMSPIIDLRASGLLVTGDVKALDSLSIASGNGVKGNVEGGNVSLDSSNAYITGNALVDHITLGWQGRVQQTITCKAYTPSNPCSCVTNNSGWPYTDPLGPKCGPGTQAGPHHFQITHPPSALSCAPAPVTVTACADAACSAIYTGAAEVTLTPGGAVAQINATQPATGTATSSVAQTTPASNVPLSLSSTLATTGALVCKSSVDGSMTNCQMAFVSSALQVSGIPRYAEVEERIAISALQASPSNPRACVPLFANQNKTLQLRCTYANPGTGTLPARIQDKDGTYIPLAANTGSACSAGGAAVQLAFDVNGQATPNMQYADAGALGLTAAYASTSGSDSGLSMTGSGNVIVGPKRFAFSAIATPQRAGLAAVPAAPATRISVSALNAAGAVTGNFGRETTAQTVMLGSILVAPTFGAANPAVAGSLAFNNGNGIGTASNMSWPEVGTIQFTATLPAYLGWTLPPVNGITPPVATGNSANVQFIPHHFATAVTGTVPMPCVAPLTCVGAQPGQSVGSFVYSRQAFGLRVTAQNASNATTKNFDGQDKSLLANVALQGYDAATGKTPMPPAVPAGSQLTDGTAAQTVVTGIAPGNFIGGIANTVIAYRFPGAYAVPAGAIALAPPTDVLFRATTTYPGGAVVTSAPSASGTEAKLTVLTGRMMVPNSYGSERLPIRLPVQVQYWNGSWLGNVSDGASKFTQADVILADCRLGLGAGACNGATKVQNGTYIFVGGVLPSPNGQLLLLAPGVAGSVNVSVGSLPYLPSTVGRAVFGVLKSGPVIYLRELY